MSKLQFTLALTFVSCAVGCSNDPKSAKGFTLPEGDALQGQATFNMLRCYECHSVSQVELPAVDNPEQALIRLGGEVNTVKTYGELVTSVINPSHKLADGYLSDQVSTGAGKSKMKNYNDVLTISQLIDLVAFLQSHYELRSPDSTIYPPYHYGP
jgi:hypothetical protein